ncbi:MAG TPA: hypothetical protein ENK52_03065, partial [Saprospiraceae bacterium]|nr:hypothetical protein [Saprospiraceae bacterium]
MGKLTYLLAFFCYLLAAPNTFAQQSFAKSFPALTEGWAIQQTQDDGFIITGRTGDIINIVDNDIFLLKTDVDGNELWSKTYGQNDLEQAFDLIQTQDGGYVIVGLSSSFSGGPTDVFFFKTDTEGNEIWQKKYGGLNVPDQANTVLESKDGNALYLAGCYDCPRPPLDPGRHDCYIIKTDKFGNLSWSKIFGDANTKEEAFDMIELADGNLLVLGTIIHPNGNEDILLYKIDANGNVLFVKNFGGPSVEAARKIIASNDGNFLIGGTSFAFDPQEIQPDAIVLKIDADGNEIWSKNYGGFGAEIITDIIMTNEGNIAFTGVTWSYGSEDGDFYLVNLDADGNELWVSSTGGLGEQSAKGFAQTNDGGYAMVGISLIGPKMEFIKTDALGHLRSNNIHGKVFHDSSSDCLFQTDERNLANWMIEARGEQTFYGTTDENGHYSIPVEQGDYIVSIRPPNAYFSPCQNNYNITLAEANDTSILDFAMQTLIECPSL